MNQCIKRIETSARAGYVLRQELPAPEAVRPSIVLRAFLRFHEFDRPRLVGIIQELHWGGHDPVRLKSILDRSRPDGGLQ